MDDGDSQDALPTVKPPHLGEERWRELLPLFDHAMDLEPAERETWLEDLAQQRPETAASLRGLLTENDELEARRFLEDGAKWPTRDSLQGRRIGAYTVEQLIGEGGMGEVWRARRSDGRFERKVAMKLLHVALVSKHARARFEREGRLLARLTHPNITPLVDAGVTAENRPYIVLEYLDGQPIDRYCDTRALGIDARLRLVQEMLGALAHAHDNLVIHRDLKPSNVLVTSAGVVKLLDFGIAKLMDTEEAGAPQPPLTSMAAEVPFTPDYAAPEQILNEPVSAATDVYQLGVLLYVLLAGSHPYSTANMGKRELLKLALDVDPPLMSERIAQQAATDAAGLTIRAQRRDVPTERMRSLLRGDLDAIVAKAMRKDPAARYSSAAALAQDIARYLDHQPVSARAGAFRYRARKFMRRHRTALATGSVAALALIATTVFALTQMREAQIQRDAARLQSERAGAESRFTNMMLTKVGEGGRPPTLEELLDSGVALLDKEYGNNPEFVVHMLIQLSGRYMDIGARRKEHAVLVKAEGVARQLGPATLAEVECDTVETEVALSDFGAADRRLAEARAALARIAAPNPGMVADCLNAEANLHAARGRTPAAIASLEQAVALLVKADRTRSVRYLGLLSHIELLQASVGNIAKAREVNRSRRQASELLGFGGTIGQLRAYHNDALYFQDVGEVREALARERDVVNRSTSKDGNPLHPTISEAYGEMLLRMEQPVAALPWLDAAIQSWHAQGAEPRELVVRAARSRVLVALGRDAEARAELPDLAQLASASDQSSRQSFVRAGTSRASVLLTLSNVSDARTQIEAVLETIRSASDCARWEIPALLVAAHVAEASGNLQEVSRYAAAALQIAQKRASNPERSADVGEALLVLAMVHYAQGDVAAAVPLVQRARTTLGNALGPQHSLTRAAAALETEAIMPMQSVDLSRADEVVLRQPADGVRRELHPAIAIAHLEIRVMVLEVRDVRDRIYEAHGAIEILELEFAAGCRANPRSAPSRHAVVRSAHAPSPASAARRPPRRAGTSCHSARSCTLLPRVFARHILLDHLLEFLRRYARP